MKEKNKKYNYMANSKVTLTITIPEEINKKLKKIVGLGKVSEFVSKAIEKDLKNREEKIISDYQKSIKDKKTIEKIKNWDITAQYK